MKEIMLWEISTSSDGPSDVQQFDSDSQAATENLLEEAIVNHPDLLMKGLNLIGRQTDTPGGPLDLLGVDEDGRLVVFELKRGVLTRDAVAQIIDYSSHLAELDPKDLSDHISERSGKLGIDQIDNFLEWYQERFPDQEPSILQRPSMVLVGLGADDRTRRMVSFLAASDLDISLITFHGFKEGERTLLARQVEVEPRKVPGARPQTKAGRYELLRQKVSEVGVDDFYYEMSDYFGKKLSSYVWPNPGGYSYSLVELTEAGRPTYRVYISLPLHSSHPRGKVQIYIQPRAVEAAGSVFDSFKEELAEKIFSRPDGGADLWVSSQPDWQELLPHFDELCPAILEGWKKKRELQEKQALGEIMEEKESVD